MELRNAAKHRNKMANCPKACSVADSKANLRLWHSQRWTSWRMPWREKVLRKEKICFRHRRVWPTSSASTCSLCSWIAQYKPTGSKKTRSITSIQRLAQPCVYKWRRCCSVSNSSSLTKSTRQPKVRRRGLRTWSRSYLVVSECSMPKEASGRSWTSSRAEYKRSRSSERNSASMISTRKK